MNTTSIVRVRPADVRPGVRSSTRERLRQVVNNGTICERIFIAVTVGMAMFFSYVCYHALQT